MTQRGQVRIESLEIDCIVGIREEERTRVQRLVIDCTMTYARLPEREEIDQAIDYTELAELIRDRAVEGRYQLIERLAAETATKCLERFPAAERVSFTVRKPGALQGSAVPSVTVTLER